MSDKISLTKADRIRDVFRYLKKFKNATIVLYIDDKIINSSVFSSHIKDLALLHDAGLKIMIVPGSKSRIDQVLTSSGKTWTYHNSCRITSEENIPLIKMAAFDVSNEVMTALAGEGITAVIGNWVRSRRKGIIDGFDYQTNGEIDKLQIDTIQQVLNDGLIPIFPCIGWNLTGKPFNISSMDLAAEIARNLKADKLFYLTDGLEINSNTIQLPNGLQFNENNKLPAINLQELESIINLNTTELSEGIQNSTEPSVNSVPNSLNSTTEHSVKFRLVHLLELANKACQNNVSRVHILDGNLDGTLLTEIFTDLGSGTMVYSTNYGSFRPMNQEDISSVIQLIKPFVEQKILLPRTPEQIKEKIPNFTVYELDGAIRACAALIPYSDGQMELSCVAVDESFGHIGIGPKLIKNLIQQAKNAGAKDLFLLTTQTFDWFEKLGFKPTTMDSLPQERQKIWDKNRNSKPMKIDF